MNRPSSTATRWCGLGVLVALIATLAALVPSSVSAQSSGDPVANIVVTEAAAGQTFRTMAVDLAAGDVGLAAFTAEVSYDASAITIVDCEVSEAGACNVRDEGTILFAVFNTSGLQDNDKLVTANFEVRPGASGSTTFDVEVVESFDLIGIDLEKFEITSTSFDLTAPTFGSVTGDVVAADSQTGIYNAEVCAVHVGTQTETCTTTSGLGTWRIDGLPTGTYDIRVSDPAQVFGTAVLAADIGEETVTTGLVAELGAYTEEADGAESDTTEADVSDTDAPAAVASPVPAPSPQAIVVTYDASITGRISSIATAQPIEGLQVCATQPLVLHQSCGTTDALGIYALHDLSAGNYWVTVTDPFNRFQDSPVELVGVQDDTSSRDRVNMQLTRIGG